MKTQTRNILCGLLFVSLVMIIGLAPVSAADINQMGTPENNIQNAIGTDENDTITQDGLAGNDTQYASGGGGNDTITQNGGNDNDTQNVDGGTGNDQITYEVSSGSDVATIDGGEDFDTLTINRNNHEFTLFNGATQIYTTGNPGTTIIIDNIEHVVIFGSLGAVIFETDIGIPPVVSAVNPGNNAVNIPPGVIITVTYSEAIQAGNLNIQLKNSTGALIPTTKTITGNVLTITPTSTLAEDKYLLLLYAGCVTDLVGDPAGAKTSNFVVGTSPTVVSTDPANYAVNIASNKVINISFNEAIKSGSLNIQLKNSTGTLIPTIKTISDNVLTITPTSTLNESRYIILIYAGSVTDLAGNPVAAKTSSFSTGSSPYSTGTDPLNYAVSVAPNKVITATFNEPILAKYLTLIYLKTTTGISVPTTKSVSGNVLTITPTSALTASTRYLLMIYTFAVTDLSGNPNINKAITFTVNTSTKKLLFIHHSCGSNWLSTGNGNLGTTLNSNNYYVSESDYGWSAEPGDHLGDRTNTDDWPEWFTDTKMPYVYASDYHSAYINTVSNPCGENEIIMFKSCYPCSEVGGSINDEKAIYNSLLPYFASHPNKFFVLVTPPGETNVGSYQLTQELCNWLVNDTGWLSGYGVGNVMVFDLYGVLSEVNSHHRWVTDHVEHVYDSNYDGTSPYHNGDNHPNSTGNQKATTEFISLLNHYYNEWKA